MAVSGLEGTRTFLTFTLGDEVFAVEVANVREVLDLTPITRVPKMPAFMRGVINLRGSVVPVVDMRTKFGLPAADDTVDTCIIVMEVDLDGERTVIGALADSVREVFELDPAGIEPPPRIGTRLDTAIIKGMGRRDDRFVIILDIDRAFESKDFVNPEGATIAGAPPENPSAAQGAADPA